MLMTVMRKSFWHTHICLEILFHAVPTSVSCQDKQRFLGTTIMWVMDLEEWGVLLIDSDDCINVWALQVYHYVPMAGSAQRVRPLQPWTTHMSPVPAALCVREGQMKKIQYRQKFTAHRAHGLCYIHKTPCIQIVLVMPMSQNINGAFLRMSSQQVGTIRILLPQSSIVL